MNPASSRSEALLAKSFAPVRHRGGALLLCMAAAAVAGCGGNQSALNPGGIQAEHISSLWWFFFWITAAVYILVLLFLLGGIFKLWGRAPLRRDDVTLVAVDPSRERRYGIVVGGAVGITVVLLFTLLLNDVFAGTALQSLTSREPLTIKVTGHQWWWEAEYQFPTPSSNITTANEIHLPVGKSVQIKLASPDVIHSFWVPNLHGKKDLIPGHPTAIWLRADKPGIYFGQCAEFCGYQHAHMRLAVVADEPAAFQNWLNAQRNPAPEPETEKQKRGQQVFLTATCVMCHTIQGTIAGARLGPNLTHIASRKILAAGRLPNNRGSLGGWILDPQHLKPGVRMPQNQFEPEDFHALLDYLETLK